MRNCLVIESGESKHLWRGNLTIRAGLVYRRRDVISRTKHVDTPRVSTQPKLTFKMDTLYTTKIKAFPFQCVTS